MVCTVFDQIFQNLRYKWCRRNITKKFSKWTYFNLSPSMSKCYLWKIKKKWIWRTKNWLEKTYFESNIFGTREYNCCNSKNIFLFFLYRLLCGQLTFSWIECADIICEKKTHLWPVCTCLFVFHPKLQLYFRKKKRIVERKDS